jgi:plasmid stabilization system protein ParE
MTKNDLKKLIKDLTKEILAEDYKGEPNHEAEVESDKLTAHLSENDKAADIKDLETLLKNPDPSRAKDYGSVENYKKMLKAKIDRLKKTNESGDPFRDIVKKYARLYRDSELARRDKEEYFRWLQTHKPEEFKKVVSKIKKK